MWCRICSIVDPCAPRRVCLETLGGAKGRGSRRMFWKLAPGDVIGKPVKLQCPEIVNAWKRRKHKMEKTSRRAWTEYEHRPGAMQLREFSVKGFWDIFVDDRLSGADAIYRQVDIQSKAAFSYAMTLMDKIRGWEDE